MARNPNLSLNRRWRSWLAGVLLLAAGAGGAYATAQWAAERIEARTDSRVRAALSDAGLDWADVATDGLNIRLSGSAPDELNRVRATTVAATAAGYARVIDRISVPRAAVAAPPPFRLEVLRNDSGTSVIGLAPQSMDRPALMSRLARIAGQDLVTDLLEQADHQAPRGWEAAVAFALGAAEQMPRARIAVTPGRVEIEAVTEGEAEKARLEQTLSETVPAGVTLATSIRAPRRVIAPFALQLLRDEDRTVLVRCAADSDAARDRILTAAVAAGADRGADCAVGLGAPSARWADAAVAGIEALAALPAGTLTITDSQITLEAPSDVPEASFAAARDALAAGLPDRFMLTATLEPPPPVEDDSPLRFTATVGAAGVELRGAVPDASMGGAITSLAAARFGAVDSGLTLRDDTPPGWSTRAMAAIEAMAALDRAAATVTPDLIRLRGRTGSPAAADEIAHRLGVLLGAGAAYEFALTYDPRLDPAVDLPTGEQCVDALNLAMQQAEIGFEPNLAVIAGEVGATITALSAELARCGDFRIEIGGHTDSQGSESFNQKLSSDRAQAVLGALIEAGVAAENLTATGYGETRPVATNDTPEGRETNRRIEFRLLSPNPVNDDPAPAVVTRGVTQDAAAQLPEQPPADAPDSDSSAQDAADANAVADAVKGTPEPATAVTPDADDAAGETAETEETEETEETTSPEADAVNRTSDPAAAVAADADAADTTAETSETAGPEAAAPVTGDSGEQDADATPPVAADIADEEGDGASRRPTPDEIAESAGVSLRPDSVTVRGSRLQTPVPPPLPEGPSMEPAAGTDAASRPPARPQE